MSKVAILTDSNSGITQAESKELGVFVEPMPFYIDGELYYEDIDLTQDEFYQKLTQGGEIKTSMPITGNLMDTWEKILEDYDELVYIPMSSGLSSSCATAKMLADDYDGRVVVVDNQRISVTQKMSALEAKKLADMGKSAQEICDALMEIKSLSTIYITVDTLEYLKKGGRLTPAVAAIGSLLKIKPVLSIYGEKLDKYAMARTVKAAKQTMIEALKKDMVDVLKTDNFDEVQISIAHTQNEEAAIAFREELLKEFPVKDIWIDPLSLSVSCHIGPGALACTITKKLIDID
ncbi:MULTISPECIES: DegV family protein [Pseudobutyrivibrio]|jgi:DegV family protein with EDD domain|uniref:DegV family protein n=1 Tax=Pseudobutyrivibrio ruminis TaxID=46206 RepID=A0A2G3DVZ9_9FIRM|nr:MULTISPECIES: DegV family protein [Pseudobutyrivibrio]PHU35073.1 DegV family protein [Pseudobutyrivibrio ruminis]SCX76995.1 EDD domain protein, DegV family [Pseudobutyrivibrio sp. AR14]